MRMGRLLQGSICCPCGRDEILALGLCSTCYTLRRQDEEYFGGHREEVLARDGYRCCIPGLHYAKRGKRPVAVHHRRPGISDPKWMITLCLGCHSKVSRTRFLRRSWPKLLIVLWREQHPSAHEQKSLEFSVLGPRAVPVPLFSADECEKSANRMRPGGICDLWCHEAHVHLH